LLILNGCNDDQDSETTDLLPGEESCVAGYARYGDYLSTQMVTNRAFGYGLYVCEFQAAKGPTCSTFWLYANEPSVRNLPEVAQNWRWNEIDFEFVPYTQATQSQYYTFAGGLPKPTVQAFGTSLDFGDPRSQNLDDKAVSWTAGKIQKDETIAEDMWIYYNTFMASGNSGAPTGGHFTLKDARTGSETPALAWNASADSLKAALDALNDGQGLFGMKGKYVVSAIAAGGKGDILAGSLEVIRNFNPADLISQLSPGQVVKSVEDASVIADGTTIASIDKSAGTVTLSKAATKAISGQTFNFQSQGAWSITFTGTSPDPVETLIIGYASLEPEGSLGKIVVGKTTGGAIVNMNISVFQPLMKPAANGTWFELLRTETGDGKIWPTAQTWKYPLSHIATPDNLPIEKMVTLNFWRSPAGDESTDIDFGGWGKPAHTGILRERPIPGTTGHPDSFTSAVLNNEAYVFDSTGAYDPTKALHTYTIVWTPSRMAQYIDAPNRGRDVSNATPIAEYRMTDFPSLDHSGPQAAGGTIPWIGTELNQAIGKVTMNVANYVAFRAASTGTNAYAWGTGSLASASSVVTNVDFLKISEGLTAAGLVGKGITGQGIPPGATIVSVDTAKKTVTMNKNATSAGASVCLTMGQEVLTGSIIEGNAIISGLDIKKLAVGQMVLGDGIPDGATVKSIDETLKTATMTLGATKTSSSVDLVFQTAPSGAGWSGTAPGEDFTAADAYVRSVGFFPLAGEEKDGTSTSDFLIDTEDPEAFWLDFSDGTWTATTFNARITKYFGILYAQDFTSAGAIPGTSALRDAKSPLNVTYENMSDGLGAMRLRCSPSEAKADRNFFVLQPKQAKDAEIGSDNPLVRAEIASKSDAVEYSAATSSVTTPSAFYAPPKGQTLDVTVKVWGSTKGFYEPDAKGNPIDPDPDYTAEITLKQDNAGTLSWTVTSDPHKVIETFQSANPHLITVKSPD
jgi:hypothetical protein